MQFRRGGGDNQPPCDPLDEAGEARLAVLAQNDPAAFAPLYARYRSRIYAHCYRATGHAADAEDLTSQTFHKALRGLPTFSGGSFERWLVTIALNVIRDYRKTNRWHGELTEYAVSAEAGPEDEAIRADSADRLHRLLRTLPDGEREVIEFRLAGYTGAEIATLTGRSSDAVRQSQRRAMQRLARLLGLPGENGGEQGGQGR